MTTFSNTCHNGHAEIGYNPTEKDDRCPLCVKIAEIELLNVIVDAGKTIEEQLKNWIAELERQLKRDSGS